MNLLAQLHARPYGVCLLLAALFLPACASLDRHAYYSSVDQPKTIAVRDPYTNHVFWTMDVPVNHKLKLNFDRKGEIELAKVSGKPATSMTWSLSGPTKHGSGSVKLYGTPVIIDVSLRPAPEYPPNFPGPQVPSDRSTAAAVNTTPAPVSTSAGAPGGAQAVPPSVPETPADEPAPPPADLSKP
ncbi:MAG: hypothetical protein IT443_02105 [Phycisphaeraceae bacterium]|nr:hypothetical protein [Phycisphaeraceae bacterium]